MIALTTLMCRHNALTYALCLNRIFIFYYPSHLLNDSVFYRYALDHQRRNHHRYISYSDDTKPSIPTGPQNALIPIRFFAYLPRQGAPENVLTHACTRHTFYHYIRLRRSHQLCSGSDVVLVMVRHFRRSRRCSTEAKQLLVWI